MWRKITNVLKGKKSLFGKTRSNSLLMVWTIPVRGSLSLGHICTKSYDSY